MGWDEPIQGPPQSYGRSTVPRNWVASGQGRGGGCPLPGLSHYSPAPYLSVPEPGDLPLEPKRTLERPAWCWELGDLCPSHSHRPVDGLVHHPIVWTNCSPSFSKTLDPALLLKDIAQWPLTIYAHPTTGGLALGFRDPGRA